jgi:hypothetical protein
MVSFSTLVSEAYVTIGLMTPPSVYSRETDPVPIVQEDGWAPGPVWRARKVSPLPGFDPWTSPPPPRSESLYRLLLCREDKGTTIGI